jgi:hypothetical protein
MWRVFCLCFTILLKNTFFIKAVYPWTVTGVPVGVGVPQLEKLWSTYFKIAHLYSLICVRPEHDFPFKIDSCLKNNLFWNVRLCFLIQNYWRFGGISCVPPSLPWDPITALFVVIAVTPPSVRFTCSSYFWIKYINLLHDSYLRVGSSRASQNVPVTNRELISFPKDQPR